MLSANKLQRVCDELTFIATALTHFIQIVGMAGDEKGGVDKLKVIIERLTGIDVVFDDVKDAWIDYAKTSVVLICNKGDETVLFELTADTINNAYVVRIS